ncbi:hypothetical protein AK812_SmicGene33334 [Symbiodinium microadriaticum]|uniref:Uncharacterized protein n=1 Tax=Symbiodinium microadriaticum TaxID=2951 RepID=A0A1Q9CRW6_SYMMI|nr:hypothetical protein AK812_SmicGene33334 [Symbiodinium microadriaticum]
MPPPRRTKVPRKAKGKKKPPAKPVRRSSTRSSSYSESSYGSDGSSSPEHSDEDDPKEYKRGVEICQLYRDLLMPRLPRQGWQHVCAAVYSKVFIPSKGEVAEVLERHVVLATASCGLNQDYSKAELDLRVAAGATFRHEAAHVEAVSSAHCFFSPNAPNVMSSMRAWMDGGWDSAVRRPPTSARWKLVGGDAWESLPTAAASKVEKAFLNGKVEASMLIDESSRLVATVSFTVDSENYHVKLTEGAAYLGGVAILAEAHVIVQAGSEDAIASNICKRREQNRKDSPPDGIEANQQLHFGRCASPGFWKSSSSGDDGGASEKDKELILGKIEDIDDFNAKLQVLIFDSKAGLVATWNAMDSLQQIGEVGRLIRWGQADAGSGKVWRAWEGHS